MGERPIYMTIMAASEAGRGVNLTAEEVQWLAKDDAIFTRAATHLPDDDDFMVVAGFTWTAALKAYLRGQDRG